MCAVENKNHEAKAKVINARVKFLSNKIKGSENIFYIWT